MAVRPKAFEVKGGAWSSDRNFLIPPVNTVLYGDQMESLGRERRGLELSAESNIPPVNTVPQGG